MNILVDVLVMQVNAILPNKQSKSLICIDGLGVTSKTKSIDIRSKFVTLQFIGSFRIFPSYCSFTSNLVSTLEGLGASDLNDLIFLSTDQGLLKVVEDAVSNLEYRKFVQAVEVLRRESTEIKELSNKALPKSQFDTATRIEKLEKEIRDLEQESYYKKDTSNKPLSGKDREKQIKQREALIDGVSPSNAP